MLKDLNNNWIEDMETIKDMFQSHFRNLLTSEIGTATWLHTKQRFPALHISVLNSLDVDLNTTEIKKELFDMAAWKSPGPDGFPTGFYQHTLEHTSENISTFIHQIWKKDIDLAKINFIDIFPIPKLENH